MSDPPPPHGSKVAAVTAEERLRQLETEIVALKLELSSAQVSPESLVHSDIIPTDNMASGAVQHRTDLTSSRAENTVLREANAGLAEEGRVLRASEGQLTRLLDAAPVAILETDAIGKFTYANDAAVQILGLIGLRQEGRRYNAIEWRLFWPGGRLVEPLDRPIARALRGENVAEVEISLTGPIATELDLVLRVSAVPVRGPDGQVEGALVTLVDVTARHRATAALQASEERSNLAFEVAGACAWELDPATGMSTWDTAARTLLCLPETLPFDEAVVSFVHHDDRTSVRTVVASALDPAGNGRYSIEHRAMQAPASAEVRWLQSLGQAYFEGSGPARRPVRLVCVTTDVTQRHAAEERRALLVAELNHRVKNALAVVQALAEQTRRATDRRFSPSSERRQFHVAFQSRLLALARAHDLLTREDWEGATLRDVLVTAAEPFLRPASNGMAREGDLDQIEVAGVPVRVGPEAAVTLAMASHELATNASKYGALSQPNGRVAVSWAILPDRTAVDLLWVEVGGPALNGPPPAERHGFGLRLLERGLARQLGGVIHVDFAATGLRCRMQLPLKNGAIAPR